MRIVALLAALSCAIAAPATATVWLELTPLELSAPSASLVEEVISWNGQRYSAKVAEQAKATSIARKRGFARLLGEDEEEELSGAEYWMNVAISVGLVCFAGIAAGCTMGILSLDPLTLNLKLLEGSANEQEWAKAVLPVVSRHHHLLVALLLCNACANEALPIFLDKVLSETQAILVSVTCVLIFGEILPSAVMTGPK